MEETCVSLDLETTGLSPQLDEIIEIGAVKFRGSDVIDVFHTPVNPLRPLPYRIQLLCGITQGELDAAPAFSQVADTLVAFLGGCPLVGHNISFDLAFLERMLGKLDNVTYDTWELATLLLFRQSDYSLSSVAASLGLALPEHRALPDAMAAKELFLALVDRARQLDAATLDSLVGLAAKSDWHMAHLFSDIRNEKAKGRFASSDVSGVTGILSKSQPSGSDHRPEVRRERVPVGISVSSELLEVEGPLAHAFPAYERRPGQIRMTEAVEHALREHEHLIVEAGTGTGKSVAYLLPSITFALENGVPVVVSTNTISLQEQLMGKDIPDLLRALRTGNHIDVDKLKVVQLKGRANYLCLRKYEALLASEALTLDEARLLARIRVWLLHTQTGDRAELNLSAHDAPLWSRICAHSQERVEAQCPYRQKGACFLHRARREAETAHLIIVNHALLLSDLVCEAKVLPAYDCLIIDEAHHLEDEASNQLGARVAQWDLYDFLGRFKKEAGRRRWTGVLPWLDECLRGSTVSRSRRALPREISGSIGSQLEKAHVLVAQFLAKAREFVESHSADTGDYECSLRLTRSSRSQPGWARVEIAWSDLDSALEGIGEDLERLFIALDGLEDCGVSSYDALVLEITYLLYRTQELRQHLNSLVCNPDGDMIYWLSSNRQTGAIGFHSAPLSVGRVLDRLLFSCKECVVLTGATLSVEGSFEFLQRRLGLDHAGTLVVEAPFDYLNSTLVCLPKEIPEPSSPRYQEAVAATMLDVCRATRGRAMALFTSYAALKAAHAAIRTPLEEEGILVLGQGIDGSAKQVLSAFRANPNSVLLGTASLWEGIDVVGDALCILIIARLPFNVPTEPTFAARSELFDDPFNEYAVPQATIRFKQGFGRLIRSKTDRGALIVLDRRLQSKRYGAAFLASIPECTMLNGPLRELPSAIRAWLDGSR